MPRMLQRARGDKVNLEEEFETTEDGINLYKVALDIRCITITNSAIG